MANMRHDFHDTELIDKVIRSIKRGVFRMADWDCCICGHLARVKNAHPVLIGLEEPVPIWGERQLGLTRRQASDLFTTNLDANRDEAIRVLEILRDEGVVDWKRAKRDVSANEADRQRREAEQWEADHQGASYLDLLHDRFDRLCEAAKALV